MLRSTSTVLFVFLAIACFGQNRSISGIIKDTRSATLQGAAIRLRSTTDSTFVKMISSDENGGFKFQNLPADMYKLMASYTGLQKFESGVLTLDDKHRQVNLPVIFLQSGKQEELKEVTVTSKKPLLEYEVDKTVMNVEAMISAASSNTLEVLERTPGVIIDPNGNISLNGKNNVLVLIDGRNTYMSSQDLASYLKSLPGSMLDKIELIENPSSRYDAAGGAIINIRLKKNKSLGLTGNISTGMSQGEKTRSNHSLNINYNKKKINIFTNIGLNTEESYNDDFNDRKYYTSTGDLRSHVLINNRFDYHSHGWNGRVGVDYNISSKTVIGLQANLNTRPRKDLQTFRSNAYNSTNILDSSNSGDMKAVFDWKNRGLNLNFQHRFNDKGKELSADLNYIEYETTGSQLFRNYKSDLLTNRFSYRLPSSITIHNFKADYTHPMKNRLALDAGIKMSLVKNNNNSGYFDGLNKQVYENSNHFLFDENINAAYVTSRKSWKRLGVQAGLRFENTHLKGKLEENPSYTGTSFTRNFNNLFFSTNISYKLDSIGNHNLGLRYARRINRPNYQQFNPFLVFRDNYSYSQGNIDLAPAYFNDAQLQYRYKQLLTIGFIYGKANDIFFPTTQLAGDKYISKASNIGKGRQLIISINLSFKITKWWQTNINMQGRSLKLWNGLYSENIMVNSIMGRFASYNQFTFSKTLSGDLSVNYNPNDLEPQREVRSKYRIEGGLQKKIIKDKGSLRLSFQDITRGWVQRDFTTNLNGTEEYHRGISDTRRVGISFSYRFGNEKFARKRRHNDDAADSEKGRVE
jgi:hypothetical protein